MPLWLGVILHEGTTMLVAWTSGGGLCLDNVINMIYMIYMVYMVYIILSIVSIWYVLSMLSTLDMLSILCVLSILSSYIISVLSVIYVIDIIDIRYKAKEKNLDNLRKFDAQFGWSIFEILPKKELDKVLKCSHHHEFSKKTTWQEAERSFSKSLSILGIKHCRLENLDKWSCVSGKSILNNEQDFPKLSIGYQIKWC